MTKKENKGSPENKIPSVYEYHSLWWDGSHIIRSFLKPGSSWNKRKIAESCKRLRLNNTRIQKQLHGEVQSNSEPPRPTTLLKRGFGGTCTFLNFCEIVPNSYSIEYLWTALSCSNKQKVFTWAVTGMTISPGIIWKH